MTTEKDSTWFSLKLYRGFHENYIAYYCICISQKPYSFDDPKMSIWKLTLSFRKMHAFHPSHCAKWRACTVNNLIFLNCLNGFFFVRTKVCQWCQCSSVSKPFDYIDDDRVWNENGKLCLNMYLLCEDIFRIRMLHHVNYNISGWEHYLRHAHGCIDGRLIWLCFF